MLLESAVAFRLLYLTEVLKGSSLTGMELQLVVSAARAIFLHLSTPFNEHGNSFYEADLPKSNKHTLENRTFRTILFLDFKNKNPGKHSVKLNLLPHTEE